jgi:hypothetical protein
VRKLALAVLAAAAGFLGVGVVADAYPPAAMTAAASPSTVPPGGAVDVHVEGCVPGDPITITLEASSDTDTCTGGAQTLTLLFAVATGGSADGVVTAPDETGTFTGSVTGPESGEANFTVVVTSSTLEATAATTGTLPSTGASGSWTFVRVAVVLVVVGVGLLLVGQARRRRARAR